MVAQATAERALTISASHTNIDGLFTVEKNVYAWSVGNGLPIRGSQREGRRKTESINESIGVARGSHRKTDLWRRSTLRLWNSWQVGGERNRKFSL